MANDKWSVGTHMLHKQRARCGGHPRSRSFIRWVVKALSSFKYKLIYSRYSVVLNKPL